MQIDKVTGKTAENLNYKTQKVRLTYLPYAKTEPKTHHFKDMDLVRFSWQGLASFKITFDELNKVDVQEVRELLNEDSTPGPEVAS